MKRGEALADASVLAGDSVLAGASVLKLVGHLRSGGDEQKESAAALLGRLATNSCYNKAVIAMAGGIPPLIALARGGTDGQKLTATSTLAILAAGMSETSADNRAAIATAGGIPPLVALVRSGTKWQREYAAAALMSLACSADNQAAIAKAGGIPPLVALARCGQMEAAAAGAVRALWNLSFNKQNLAAMKGLGYSVSESHL